MDSGDKRKTRTEKIGPILLTLIVDRELLEKIDNLRFSERFPSRAETMRWLLEWSLEHGVSPDDYHILD